jgi:hypothetical protein
MDAHQAQDRLHALYARYVHDSGRRITIASRMRIIGASRQRFRKISGVRLYLELVERQIPELRCLVSEYW